ncbi:hypothetical protein HZI56_04635 [Lactobacillus salivarius]|nr:hypothetical protein [Ligilactobacillus salivarius]MBE7938433.1 hypothetical protein [Ligilactobacillus salivarius]MDG9755530.1 hypothetical protein [Ligilactobacillus salivarius]MDQ4442971.1 hypothetical protein [Ligilactobacillus salivarius]NRD05308.1 hypothetical protein [Ligilactobacillus salivarius]NXZ95800.1 hypothetical protein [Ligilactobacillus salivarius]
MKIVFRKKKRYNKWNTPYKNPIYADTKRNLVSKKATSKLIKKFRRGLF